MNITSREDFTARISAIIGERVDDDALSFVQDMTETFDAFQSQSVPENYVSKAEHEKAMQDADTAWRNKYKAAFLTGTHLPDEKDAPADPHYSTENPRDFSDLFK